jgi:hypothetical protein
MISLFSGYIAQWSGPIRCSLMEPNYPGFWTEPQQARARGTSGLAIAALILGIIGL